MFAASGRALRPSGVGLLILQDHSSSDANLKAHHMGHDLTKQRQRKLPWTNWCHCFFFSKWLAAPDLWTFGGSSSSILINLGYIIRTENKTYLTFLYECINHGERSWIVVSYGSLVWFKQRSLIMRGATKKTGNAASLTSQNKQSRTNIYLQTEHTALDPGVKIRPLQRGVSQLVPGGLWAPYP